MSQDTLKKTVRGPLSALEQHAEALAASKENGVIMDLVKDLRAALDRAEKAEERASLHDANTNQLHLKMDAALAKLKKADRALEDAYARLGGISFSQDSQLEPIYRRVHEALTAIRAETTPVAEVSKL